MAEVDYVFQLSTPGRGRAAERIVEDELANTLERLSELLDGKAFELSLIKRPLVATRGEEDRPS